MELGIDTDKNLVYEGSGHWGHPIWPTPLILPAKFISPSVDKIEPHPRKFCTDSYIFREVNFDPVTRVRRGFLYHANSSMQPATWHVSPHPVINQESHQVNEHGVIQKRLYSFGQFSLTVTLREFQGQLPLIILGTIKSFTVWNILSYETDAANNELIALKSRMSYGALPNLNINEIPEECRSSVQTALAILQEDIYRAGPISVVDRCREAVTAILSAYCQKHEIAVSGQDLGKLIRTIRDKSPVKRDVVSNLADTIRLFHTRGKSAPQEKMNLRTITEQDGELAVQAVGVILCDLGWVT